MTFIKLFDSTIIVSGYGRALIYDSENDLVRLIPKDLYEILIKDLGFDINSLIKKLDSTSIDVLHEYIDFLITNKLAFYCDSEKEFRRFKRTLKTFEEPFELNNLIIDIDKNNWLTLNLLSQIIENKISYLQIRFCNKIEVKKFKDFLTSINCLSDSFVQEVIFVIEYDFYIYNYLVKEKLFLDKYLTFIFYNCKNGEKEQVFENLQFNFISEKLIFPYSCGMINKNNFIYSQNFYLESQNYNTCLNRKISIDKDGNIKNCPSMNESFGNIKDTTLDEALNHPNFKKYWNINKDQIDVCKDCEFRHICTDCRAYIEDPQNQYSKPLKCGYNPYTNEWSEWSTNPLKQKAIEFYGMQELIKKDA